VKAPREGHLLDGVVKFALSTRGDFKKGTHFKSLSFPSRGMYVVSAPMIVPKQGLYGVYIAMVATHVTSYV
jgi:hypothetical protein